MSIPDRYAAKVERLGEIANRNEGTDVGDLAVELASFVAETTFAEPGSSVGIDRLASEVDARFTTHELAITELYRRIGPDPRDQADATVFHVPVALADGVTREQIRAAIDELPPGLDKDTALATLEERGLLTRTDKKEPPK